MPSTENAADLQAQGGGGDGTVSGGGKLAHPQDSTASVEGQAPLADALISGAKALHERGFAVVPIRAGSKAPSLAKWQTQRLSWPELERALRRPGISGIGVVAGALSGGLVVLDFDGGGWQAAFDHFMESWP